jgi:Pregnancy-associated plasma protein-A
MIKNTILLGALLFVLWPLQAQLHYTYKDLPCLDKNFNLHFHIVMDSLRSKTITRAEIEEGIKDLNQKFKPICVSFSVCKIDTLYDYAFDSLTLGIELAKLHIEYQHSNRLNVFIISELYEKIGEKQFPICGVAGTSVTIAGGCYGALAHEFGHTFSLAHTFEGGGDELVDGSNCQTAGDLICDTPSDPYVKYDPMFLYLNDKCEFINEKKDKNGEYYNPQVGNVMSYYGCPCSSFTRQQYLRMAAVIQSSFINFW